MLDVGCGTGLPTLFMLKKFDGKITAADPDQEAIEYLKQKAVKSNLNNQFTLLNQSLFDLKGYDDHFDIVLAEGLLNIIGFEKGFIKLVSLAKSNGFIILHDEVKDHKRKLDIIANANCELLNSFVLNQQIWWEDYYKCLESAIANCTYKELLELFNSDKKEIKAYKKNPTPFQSIYYIIKKN